MEIVEKEGSLPVDTDILRGHATEKSTFFKELTPVCRPMSFPAKGKKKNMQNERQTNTSHCPTKTRLTPKVCSAP